MAAASDDDFLLISLSKRSVLVVGDGNFSFSLCLARKSHEVGLNTRLVLTSFDNWETLRQDDVANQNLRELEVLSNVVVFHAVNATNLSKHFPDQQFGRIIFNFPHTGGKSNIRKCRKLLEEFFSSASRHLDADEGDICVTLCKGQGGTPLDEPQRAHGNSWKIVENAAKAGLILHKVLPFVSSHYPNYKSVGFRSRLNKGFHTSGGLIHIFVPGIKIDPVQDLSGKTADFMLSHIFETVDNLRKNASLHIPGHPLHVLKEEIRSVLSCASHHLGTSFKEIDTATGVLAESVDADNTHDYHYFAGSAIPDRPGQLLDRYIIKNTPMPRQKILSAFKKNDAFALYECAVTIPGEISLSSNIITNSLVVGKLLSNTHGRANVGEELQFVVDCFKELVCGGNYGDEECQKFKSESFSHDLHMSDAGAGPMIRSWTNSSQVAHLAKRKRHLTNTTNLQNSSSPKKDEGRCNCWKLCQNYLGRDGRLNFQEQEFSELILPGTLQLFRSCSTIIMALGHLNPEILKQFGIEEARGWLIRVNLDALAVTRCRIGDIRLLWSSVVKMEKMTMTNKVDDVRTPVFVLKPVNLFPPSYTHDISFWVSDDVSQELFILAATALTQNCVKEIKLTEIYHDEEKHCLSFNYRMIYSRSDGPLSHLEAVELQNRLRRALLALNYGLK